MGMQADSEKEWVGMEGGGKFLISYSFKQLYYFSYSSFYKSYTGQSPIVLQAVIL